MMKITLEAITVVESIQRNGSFAAAAAELCKVPSAITYAVNKLEGDIDLKLFVKSGRHMQLTSAGEEFLQQGKLLLSQAIALERNASKIASGWESELRIAINDIVPDAEILQLFERFYEQFDSTNIKLSREVLSGSWDALLSKRVDLIIAAPHYIPSKEYQVSAFCELEFVFVVNKEHPLAAQQGALSDEQIKIYRVAVVADSNRSLIAMNFDVFKEQKILTFPNHQMKIEAQKLGLCIGSVAKHLVVDLIKSGELIVKHIENSSIVGSHQTYFAYDKQHKGKALEWFIKELNVISANQSWLV